MSVTDDCYDVTIQGFGGCIGDKSSTVSLYDPFLLSIQKFRNTLIQITPEESCGG